MPAASTGRGSISRECERQHLWQPQPVPTEFRNVDGERLEDGRYAAFREEAAGGAVKPENDHDPVRTFAYGTRVLLPVDPEDGPESGDRARNPVSVKLARHRRPSPSSGGDVASGQAAGLHIAQVITYGQAAGDAIGDEGKTITVEPGLIDEVNRLLGSYAKRHEKDTTYRLGPDPASIDSCMIGVSRRPDLLPPRARAYALRLLDGAAPGVAPTASGRTACVETPARPSTARRIVSHTTHAGGIVNNNSSGMCCGVAQNTYHTLKDLRVVFGDAGATVLDRRPNRAESYSTSSLSGNHCVRKTTSSESASRRGTHGLDQSQVLDQSVPLATL